MRSYDENSLRRTKIPTACRFFGAVVIAIASVAASGSVLAQGASSAPRVLTEDEAVRQALERHEDLWNAQIDADEAEALDVEAWPNPEVGYTREHTFAEPQAAYDDFLLLEQTLPLSGRRGLQAEAARTRAQATRLETRAGARRLTTRVRRAFYLVLSAERRVQARSQWLEQMKEVETAMGRRVEAGESAPYELERLRREVADVLAAVSSEQVELFRQRALLAGLLGQPTAQDQLTLRGELLPETIPDDKTVRAALAMHPEIAAAQKRMAAADLDVEAASRWWVPTPTITGGYKGSTANDDRFHGFVFGLALGIPIFDQRAGERLAARAALVRAQNRQKLVEARLSAEILGLARQVRALTEAAAAYRNAGVERAQRVLEVARQAYDAGEVGILELIDAYRGAVDSRLRLLELQSQARQRSIALQQSLRDLDEPISSSQTE